MDLPITIAQAKKAARWMKTNFEAEMAAAAPNPPIDSDLLCAVACQETATIWLRWVDDYAPSEIVEHCVFDASGDVPKAPRKAFPVNTAAFRAEYGDAFTKMLIAEANAMRAMRSFKPAEWVYKGYGIFQYDLQHVRTDREFFEKRQWRDFSQCAKRAVKELSANFARYGDLRTAVRAYNGQGARAETYADNVMAFLDAVRTVRADADSQPASAAPVQPLAVASAPASASSPAPAAAAASAAPAYPRRLVKVGEADAAIIAALQRELKAQGYGKFEPGAFDEEMRSLVALFQSQHVDREGRPLTPDGVIGPLTWAAIFGSQSAPPKVTSSTSALLKQAVSVAEAEVGVMESPPGSNHGDRVNQYLQSVGIPPAQGTADDRYWCMAFTYFCVNAAAQSLTVANPLARTAGVLDQWRRCRDKAGIHLISKGEAVENPALVRPGQLLILDHGGGLGHTGIVSETDGAHLTVIEGNSSGRANDRNGVGVFRTTFRKTSDHGVKGFIDYDS